MKPRPRRYHMAVYTAWYPGNREVEEVVFQANTVHGWQRILGVTIPMGLPWEMRFVVNSTMCRWLEPR